MSDTKKTKQQLIQELLACRQQLDKSQTQEDRHKKTRKALCESEQRYRHLVENSLGLICIHDLQGILLTVNPAAALALGYQPGEGVGCSLKEFLSPSVQPFFATYLGRICRNQTDSGTMRVVTKTGQERLWMYRNVRCEEKGRPAYVVGHAIDITEWEQAKDALQRARDVLEQQVQERTAALSMANTTLRAEIAERKQIESALRASEAALQTSRHELQILAGKLIFAQEEEQRRLARELHDDVAQRLAACVIDLTLLERLPNPSQQKKQTALRTIRDQVACLAQDIQHLSHQLHPAILQDLGLVDAIQSECTAFSRREGIPATFTAQDIPENIAKEAALSLYRITQESLRNVAKHAQATAAHLTLNSNTTNIILSIQDTGVGFDPTQYTGDRGLGLTSMAERVRFLQGQLSIDSQPDRGTCVTATIPLIGDLHETPPTPPRRRS